MRVVAADGLDVVVEALVEGVACHGGGVAQDEEFHAGAGNGDIHAAQVAQKADLALVVGAYQRDEDDVAFLPLETIDGVDRNQVTERFEKGAFLDPPPQVLHLGTVGRDDAHVDAVVQNALLADAQEINL